MKRIDMCLRSFELRPRTTKIETPFPQSHTTPCAREPWASLHQYARYVDLAGNGTSNSTR
jgi:hypothetical protein